jgi:hypothetical protein
MSIGIAKTQISATPKATGGGGGGTTVTSPFIQYATGSGNVPFFTTNAIVICQFTLPYAQLVTNIVISIFTADGSHNNDVGIYDTSGNLKCHAGAQTMGSTGSVSFAMTAATTLAAGTYFLALTSASNVIRFSYNSVGATSGISSFSTSTTSTGGALPSTITLSTTIGAAAYNTPVMLLT